VPIYARDVVVTRGFGTFAILGLGDHRARTGIAQTHQRHLCIGVHHIPQRPHHLVRRYEARGALGQDLIERIESAADALEGADGAVVATDWPEFDDLSFEGMARSVVVDGRRIEIDEESLEVYEGLTW
jgi:hypothetical protein